jgi:hypothetical protein
MSRPFRASRLSRPFPRAVPWAGIFRPFRAATRKRLRSPFMRRISTPRRPQAPGRIWSERGALEVAPLIAIHAPKGRPHHSPGQAERSPGSREQHLKKMRNCGAPTGRVVACPSRLPPQCGTDIPVCARRQRAGRANKRRRRPLRRHRPPPLTPILGRQECLPHTGRSHLVTTLS